MGNEASKTGAKRAGGNTGSSKREDTSTHTHTHTPTHTLTHTPTHTLTHTHSTADASDTEKAISTRASVEPDTAYDEASDEHAVAITSTLGRMKLSDNREVPVAVEDFELMKVLGKGSFGKVFLVSKKTGVDAHQTYAMKVLRKEVLLRRNQIEHTKSERAILANVSHPFIVQMRYAFQTREKLYLVTDFASGGELFFWLKRERVFSQSRARLYAAELVLALEHLHSLDIVYRDLKPENILLDDEGHIKLTDFGLSKMDVTGFGAEGGTKTFCGTPEYLAPEILENRGHGKAVDWWSLGTLLYEMMAGLPPFYDTNTELMYEKILTAELKFPRHFLPETRSLLAGMLTRKVEERLGYRRAAEVRAHPFFTGIDWDAVYHRRYAPQFVPPPNGIEGVPADDGTGHAKVAVVSNFEDEFTKETPVDSVDERSKLSSTAVEKTHFDGFTYMDTGALAAAAYQDGRFDGGALRGSRGESFSEPAGGSPTVKAGAKSPHVARAGMK